MWRLTPFSNNSCFPTPPPPHLCLPPFFLLPNASPKGNLSKKFAIMGVMKQGFGRRTSSSRLSTLRASFHQGQGQRKTGKKALQGKSGSGSRQGKKVRFKGTPHFSGRNPKGGSRQRLPSKKEGVRASITSKEKKRREPSRQGPPPLPSGLKVKNKKGGAVGSPSNQVFKNSPSGRPGVFQSQKGNQHQGQNQGKGEKSKAKKLSKVSSDHPPRDVKLVQKRRTSGCLRRASTKRE